MMYKKCLYLINIFVIYILTFSLTLPTSQYNHKTKQSVPRFQRSLLDELKGVDENELWNFLTKNTNEKENDNEYDEVTDDGDDEDFGSLFGEDEEENTPTTVTADGTSAETLENGKSKTELVDYNKASTMLSKTKPVQPTTGMPIEENETTQASWPNSTTPDTRNRTSEETTTIANTIKTETTRQKTTTSESTTDTTPEEFTTSASTTGSTPEETTISESTTGITSEEITTTAGSTTETTPQETTTSENVTDTTTEQITTSGNTTGTTPEEITTSASIPGSTPKEITTTESATSTIPEEITTTAGTTETTLQETTASESTTDTTSEEITTSENITETIPQEIATSESTTGTTPEEITTTASITETTQQETTTSENVTDTSTELIITSGNTTGTTPEEITTSASITDSTPKEITTTESATSTIPEEITTTAGTTETTLQETTASESTTDTTSEEITTSENITETIPQEIATSESTTGTTSEEITTTASITETTQQETTTTESTTDTTSEEITTSENITETIPQETTTTESTTGTTPEEITTTASIPETTQQETTTTESTTGTTSEEITTTASITETTQQETTTTESTTGTTPEEITTTASITETTQQETTTTESTTGTTPEEITTTAIITETTQQETTTTESTTGTASEEITTTASITETTQQETTTTESTTGTTPEEITTTASITETTQQETTTTESTTGTTPEEITTTASITETTQQETTTTESTTGTTPEEITTTASITETTQQETTTSDSTMDTTPEEITITASTTESTPQETTTSESTTDNTPEEITTTASTIETTQQETTTTESTPEEIITTASTTETTSQKTTTTESTTGTTPEEIITTASTTETTPQKTTTSESTMDTTPEEITTTASSIETIPQETKTTESTTDTIPEEIITTASTTETTPQKTTTSESTTGTTLQEFTPFKSKVTTPQGTINSGSTAVSTPSQETTTSKSTGTASKGITISESTTFTATTKTKPTTAKDKAITKSKPSSLSITTPKGTTSEGARKITFASATTTSKSTIRTGIPKTTVRTTPRSASPPKSQSRAEKPSSVRKPITTKKPKTTKKPSRPSVVSTTPVTITTTKSPILSVQLTKPPTVPSITGQITTTQRSKSCTTTTKPRGTVATTVPSLTTKLITESKKKFDPSKMFGITLDPKAKFDISAEEGSVTETTKPAFRPVDNRNYTLHSSSNVPQLQVHTIPVCVMGPRDLQCFYVEQNVYRSNLPSNSPGHGQIHPHEQPHVEVRPLVRVDPHVHPRPHEQPHVEVRPLVRVDPHVHPRPHVQIHPHEQPHVEVRPLLRVDPHVHPRPHEQPHVEVRPLVRVDPHVHPRPHVQIHPHEQPHVEVRPLVRVDPHVHPRPHVQINSRQQPHSSVSHSLFAHRTHNIKPEYTTKKPEPVAYLPRGTIKPNVINAQVYHSWPSYNNGSHVLLPNGRIQIQSSHLVHVPNRRNPLSTPVQHHSLPGTHRNIQTPQSQTFFIRGQPPADVFVRNNYENPMYRTHERHKRSLKLKEKRDITDVEDYLQDENNGENNSEEDEDGITLAFVFDTTGSMGPELGQVKEQAIKIANSILDNPARPIYDYVFVAFHDENVPKAPIRTRDHNLFLSVINKINVQNGGDCPEKCLGGVIKAINMSRPYSPIYVFTDAYAKDYHLEEEVINLIQRKHPQIFFLTTGVCEDNHQLFGVYRRIAASSSGHVFQTRKNDIKEILKYVQGSLKKGKVLLSSVNSNKPARTPHNFPISVDKSLKEFTVTASGHNTKINVLNPQGNLPDPKQIKPVLNLNNVKVINVQEPEPGIWTVKVKSNSPYSVVSTGLSTINFVYGFSILKPGNIGETSKRPLKSAGNYLIIKATDATNLKTVTEVKVINLKGTVLDTIPMKELPLEKGVFGGGPRVPPDGRFKLEINGLGCDGYNVRRVTTTAISPQLPGKPFIDIKEKITIKVGKPYNLTCNIESLVPISVKLYRIGSRPTSSHYNQTTDITLYFDKMSKNDEGTYICWAKNVAGVELKETQIKVIVVPPAVKVNDIIVAKAGEITRIPCIVESAVKYKLSWYKSKSSSDNCWSSIIPLYNHTLEESTLIIPRTDVSDEGWYICVASNEAGETRGKTYLTVQEFPDITTQDMVTFQKGHNISLECSIIKGNPIPTLIWYKNNYPLQESNYKRLENRNSSLILTVFSADKLDEGIYKCDAVSSIGKATRDVEVIYQERPQITATKKDIKTTIGRDLLLECIVNGHPLPDISWWKSGKPVNFIEMSNTEIIANKLIIRKVSVNHSGNYTCVGKNVIGESQDHIKVLVGSAPQFSQPWRDKKIEIGKSDQLYCLASAHPKPVIAWKHDNKYLDNGNRIFFDITEATLEDGGVYECNAENIFGKAQHKIFVTITGTSPPIIKKINVPEIIKHVTGDRVELSCPVIQGKPKPNITWYMDNNLIDDAHFNGYTLNKGTVVINKMTATHVGQYECIAENPLGVDRKQIMLKLYEPPKIDKNAQFNVEAVEGSNVTFVCNVTGDPTPLVIWSRISGRYSSIMRGHKEDGSNNLFFTAVTAEDIGDYICRAKNIAGIAKQVYALKVIVPPRIVKWQGVLEVEVGNLLSLHCNVNVLANATIRWLKDNKTNGIYGPYLRFYAASSDRGRYSCVAENKAGSDRADVNVVILESPVITSIAPKVEILNGEDLWVHCNATGTPEPEISWYFQGQIIANQTAPNKNNLLHIEKITASQNGIYTCVVTNKVGQARKTTEVKILQPPIIKPWESIYKVIPGEEVTMMCEVTAAPIPSITWYKNGQPLAQDYLVNEGMIKFYAEKHHSGEYSCKAKNKVGNDTTSLTLIVLEPPIFSRNLPNVLDILLGENADLPCVAFGDPKPNIIWSKIQEPQKLHDSRFIPYENGTLKIIQITREDEGFYTCTAQNKAGSVVRQMKLNVLEKPQAKLTAKSAIVHENDELSLSCDTSGKPKPKIIWMKDGDLLYYASNNNTFRLTARSRDSGIYSCAVENIVGKAEDSINITVYVAPSISGPKEESVIGLKGEDIVLRCQLQGVPKPTIRWIRNNTELLYSRDHYRLLTDSLIMKNLTLSMASVYVCEVKNVVGTSNKLFRVNIHARPEIMNNLITNITLNEGDNYHITCTVAGVPTPVVHWMKDRTPFFVGYNDGKILILEDNTLVLANVKSEMTGIYQCRASNIHGEISRNYTVLVVVPTRAIAPGVRHLEIIASDTGTLTCPLNESLPLLKIIWLKDNQPIGNIIHERADDVHISISNGKQLKITEAYPEDTGNYTCVGIHPTMNTSSDFLVDVLIRPQFIDEYPPDEYKVKQSGTLKIDCSSSGHPTPRVHWSFLEKNLPVTEITVPGFYLEGENNELLIIRSAKLNHTGKYVCTATNKLGKERRDFQITVTVPGISSGRSL